MNSTVRTPAVSLFVAAVALALAACGDQPSAPADQPATSAAQPDATPAAPAAAPAPRYPGDLFEHPAASQLRIAGNCSVDRVNGQAVGATPHALGEELLVGGWFAPPQGVQARRALIVFDNGSRQFAHVFQTGGKRDDVATQLQRPELATSGFNQRVTLKSMPAGEYTLWLAQEGQGGFRCNSRKSITVNH